MSNKHELKEKIDELACRITTDIRYLVQLLDEVTDDEEDGVANIFLTDYLSLMLVGKDVSGNNKISVESEDKGWVEVSYNQAGLQIEIYNNDGLPVQADSVPASKLAV